jgi:hypothetical protein
MQTTGNNADNNDAAADINAAMQMTDNNAKDAALTQMKDIDVGLNRLSTPTPAMQTTTAQTTTMQTTMQTMMQ